MTDRPVLFSAPMVRAILAGTKTQTRRVMPARPLISTHDGRPVVQDRDAVYRAPETRYKVGDRLWVRETFLQSLASRQESSGEWDSYWSREKVEYCADVPEPVQRHLYPNRYNSAYMHRRPSIHMPRWASRLTLTVTDARVERLQDISEADAVAEGIQAFGSWFHVEKANGLSAMGTSARVAYALLWNSINGPGAWDRNPWVAAYTFRPYLTNIDAMEAVA